MSEGKDQIKILDLGKLLTALSQANPGFKLEIHGDVNVNVNVDNTSTTSIQINYAIVESLQINATEKQKVKGALEKFASMLGSFNSACEGLQHVIGVCQTIGAAAAPAIAEAIKHFSGITW